jgi:hypothetical protein
MVWMLKCSAGRLKVDASGNISDGRIRLPSSAASCMAMMFQAALLALIAYFATTSS